MFSLNHCFRIDGVDVPCTQDGYTTRNLLAILFDAHRTYNWPPGTPHHKMVWYPPVTIARLARGLRASGHQVQKAHLLQSGCLFTYLPQYDIVTDDDVMIVDRSSPAETLHQACRRGTFDGSTDLHRSRFSIRNLLCEVNATAEMPPQFVTIRPYNTI